MTENNDNMKNVIIIGTGLVGSLCACFMAKRGYDVEVFEKREDLRTAKEVRGRSINLALSHRGRQALSWLGLEEELLETAIPMKGRLLHSTNGNLKPVIYDPVFNQCIYSISRNHLNKKLIEATEEYRNVKINFNHVLTSSDFSKGIVTFINLKTCQEFEKKADLIIGADGAYSKLRLSMQLTPQFQYNQQYIEHGYLELCINPGQSHKLIPNYLHIWPRGKFMMIALPNQDHSWTVTLFMPLEKFEKLSTKEAILKFFEETFPDSVDLIGRDQIIDIFMQTRPSQLVSIKCSPYHIGKFLIIGDAAHAMVPFYGQGMNAGFEDCWILNNLLEKNQDNIEQTLIEFSNIRVKSAHAICDLAMYNYIEMRDLVNTFRFHLRKIIDNCLFKIFPNRWIPLYNSVSFSNMNYEICIQNRKWQDEVILKIIITTGIIIGTLLLIFIKTN